MIVSGRMYKCECKFPVLSGACCMEKEKLPESEGMINGKSVKVLRGTSCLAVVVRRSLVKDEQFIGKRETCQLIDGTLRNTLVVKVEIYSPFQQVSISPRPDLVTAMCMENPLSDVIIGDVPNVKNKISQTVKLNSG